MAGEGANRGSSQTYIEAYKLIGLGQIGTSLEAHAEQERGTW
jgi:hypothetical protein